MNNRIVYLMRGLQACGKSYRALRLAGDEGIVLETGVLAIPQQYTQPVSAGSFVRKHNKFEFKAQKGATGITKIEIRDDGRIRVKAKKIELGDLDLSQPIEFSIQIGNDLGSLLIPFEAITSASGTN